jgi:hypothetical protein
MKTPWQIESSSGKGGLLAVGSLLAGILFLWLTSRIAVQDSNTTAAMWLGVLLAGVGLAGLIFDERIVTTVDPGKRCLRIDCRRRWGSVTLTVPFDEVGSVNVVRVGSHSDGTPSYWLQIERQGGRVHSTGRWSTNDAEIRRLAGRLAGEIGCDCRGGNPLNPATATHVLAAAVGAVVLYAVWFRFSAGPWCPAMWFGTAPPVIILAGFALLLGLFRGAHATRVRRSATRRPDRSSG